ncbi:MAG: Tryptophan synthase alpha chain [Labilithrix sp.]|nr:Tryptophan synthase alpha chain [Labilithrix sp.]
MRQKRVSVAKAVVVLVATATVVGLSGCGGIFGLSDYSFDAVPEGGVALDGAIDGNVSHPDGAVPDGGDSGPPVATCTDKTMNGLETDVDCGGKSCPKCAAKKQCVLTTDCVAPLACVDLLCLSPSASDGVLDGEETDVDCGGPTAPTCGTSKTCASATDCKDKICTGNKCAAPTPTDNVQNGDETDVDCGGGSAPTCGDAKQCINGFRDCVSRVCTNQHCKPASPTDGYKNGTETDVDCGGGGGNPTCIVGKACVSGQGPRDCTSAVCTGNVCIAAAVNDGVKNGTETDVDCGGGAAAACTNGKACVTGQGARDCTSRVCTGSVCQAPTFTDGVKNGSETDVDCGGGGGTPRCADNKTCAVGSRDCSSLVCSAMGSCLAPTFSDGVKNGSETDVDCGGGGGNPACNTGQACVAGPQDCKNKVCTGGACAAPTSNDNQQNGEETDVDCGGGTAPACAVNKHCAAGARDCTSGVCTATLCQAPAPNDGVKNGTETDVDCGGGGLNPTCAAGKTCVLPTDCASNDCAGGVCN